MKSLVENSTINTNTGIGRNTTLLAVFKGILLSFAFTLVFLFIFSIFLTYTNIQEATIAPVIIVLTGISILAGATISTRKVKKNGILNGGIIGFIYILLLYYFSSLIETGFSLTLYSILMIVFAILAGMIGGIVGVNTKK